MSDQDFSQKSFPWLRSGFDLEGYVGALAAWLVGILLGILWGPLFWIGFVAAIIILFATRTAERTSPEAEGLIIAPTDGVVVSVGGATPPDELRLDGARWTRVRVAIGPTKTNGIHAPMDGAIDHVISEIGDPAAFAAMRPDRPGLTVAFVSLVSGDRAVGLRLATGGLGPRLEIANEAGDAVRLGRNIGTLRMGGWCDLYVPAGVDVLPLPGQTLIGAETIIARFDGADVEASKSDGSETPREIEAEPEPEPDPEPTDEAETVIEEEDELTLEELTGEDATPDADEEEDISEMFARLRQEAKKIQDDD
ncbi:MAG: phosphatidylserine decarboxylase [Pseudomonadota bacterium]